MRFKNEDTNEKRIEVLLTRILNNDIYFRKSDEYNFVELVNDLLVFLNYYYSKSNKQDKLYYWILQINAYFGTDTNNIYFIELDEEYVNQQIINIDNLLDKILDKFKNVNHKVKYPISNNILSDSYPLFFQREYITSNKPELVETNFRIASSKQINKDVSNKIKIDLIEDKYSFYKTKKLKWTALIVIFIMLSLFVSEFIISFILFFSKQTDLFIWACFFIVATLLYLFFLIYKLTFWKSKNLRYTLYSTKEKTRGLTLLTETVYIMINITNLFALSVMVSFVSYSLIEQYLKIMIYLFSSIWFILSVLHFFFCMIYFKKDENMDYKLINDLYLKYYNEIQKALSN